MIVNVKNFFFCGMIYLVGISTWQVLERFQKIPPMCIIDEKSYEKITGK